MIATIPRVAYKPIMIITTDHIRQRAAYSALVMIALDFILFGGTLASFGCLLPVTMLVGFLVTIFAVNDTPSECQLKACVAAVLVGLPFPLFGSLGGIAVLGLSIMGYSPYEL